MKKGGWLVLLGLSLATSASAESLQVITYNLGLAQAGWIDLVPCRGQRLVAQLQAIPQVVRPPFVLLLQEVLGGDAEKDIRVLAEVRRWYVTKTSTAGRGLMILSSQPLGEESFTPFSRDNFLMRRGILKANVLLGLETISVWNTHTAFSGPRGADPSHVQQLKEILAEARKAKGATILGGDFNLGEGLVYGENEQGRKAEGVWKSLLGHLKKSWFESELPSNLFTRDERVNPLLDFPATLIRMGGGWKTHAEASIDHIFIHRSVSSVPEETNLAFNQLEAIPGCPTNSEGLTALSDHFGVQTDLPLPLEPSAVASR